MKGTEVEPANKGIKTAHLLDEPYVMLLVALLDRRDDPVKFLRLLSP